MKHCLFFLAFVLSYIYVYPQVVPELSTHKLGLSKNIKQVVEDTYIFNYKKIEFQHNSLKTYIFENDVLIRETEDFIGALPSYTTIEYTFNSAGLLLKKSTTYTGKSETKTSAETYTYEKGKLVVITNEKSNGFSYKIEYKYDSKGKALKATSKNSEGAVTEVQDFYNVTDSRNYSIKISSFTVKNQIEPYSVITNEYKNGLLLVCNNEKTKERTAYQYDILGNLTKSNSSNSNSTTNTYEYDNQGNWISRKTTHFSSNFNSLTDIYTFRKITYSDNSVSGQTAFDNAFYDRNPSQVKNTDHSKVEKTYEVLNKSGDCENGYGIIMYPKGEKYEGYFKNGKRAGPGRYEYANRNYYIGNWVDDKKEGYGYLNMGNGTEYFGYFHNDKFNGNGVYLETYFLYQGYYSIDGVLKETYLLGNNNRTLGCVQGDCNNGFGKYVYSNDKYFIGFFYKGEIKHGVYIYSNSEKYVGEFSENKKEGFGLYFYGNKDLFYGYYKQDKHAGLGVYKNYLFQEKNLIGEFDDKFLIKNYEIK